MANLYRDEGHANLYSQFRPKPPVELIEEIIAYVKTKINRPLQNALDIGCGSGQSTVILAPYFQQVTGVDASDAQIKFASENRSAPNVRYRTSLAESLDFPDSSFDLVTACEAIHWFDLPKFFSEVKRILVPNGVIAAYGYWIPVATFENPDKTKIFRDLIERHIYNEQMGKYWNKQRELVFNHYRDIELPFSDCVRNEKIVKKFASTLSDYIAYLSTWSSYQAFLKEDPNKAKALLDDVQKRMMDIVEESAAPEEITLNLHSDFFLIMGKKEETP